MRTAIYLAAAAAWFTVAAPAGAAEGQQSFQHDGYTYVYTTADADGGRLITGHRLPDRSPFRLVVKGHRVTGTSGNARVAFDTTQARGAAGGMAAVGR